MTENDFWTKSFFLAQKNYYDSPNWSPTVYDELGEPLLRDKYNFIEYCARYADMCLEEYRCFLDRVNKERGETEPVSQIQGG